MIQGLQVTCFFWETEQKPFADTRFHVSTFRTNLPRSSMLRHGDNHNAAMFRFLLHEFINLTYSGFSHDFPREHKFATSDKVHSKYVRQCIKNNSLVECFVTFILSISLL